MNAIQRRFVVLSLALLSLTAPAASQTLPGFTKLSDFREQVRWSTLDSGVRVVINAPLEMTRPRRLLVIYATPNGSTLEQTFGAAAGQGADWKFDVQHVGAQVRRLREVDPQRDVVLAIVQAPRLSWPAFRQSQPQANTIIRDLVTLLQKETGSHGVALTCHSGGGSFLFGYFNAVEELPPELERVVFLDANYGYSDADHHGDKLMTWLKGDTSRRLVVIAYDDREITLNGKKVVGPDGGTYRASQRMLTRFRQNGSLNEQTLGPFQHFSGFNGQAQWFIHPNHENKILHTVLVGEMNGLLHGMTLGAVGLEPWGEFGGPRAYGKHVAAKPLIDPTSIQAVRAVIDPEAPELRLALPDRPADAPSGSQFRDTIARLPREQREAAVLKEILRGNVPSSLRRFVPLKNEFLDEVGMTQTATYYVLRDYLAVGSDEDFFRMPMTPQTAIAIADAAECSLITAKVSDDVFAAATVRLDPRPLTRDREAPLTFYEHHQIIEDQLRQAQITPEKRGSMLVTGIKKDVVLSSRLKEKPHKVAIYGWHHITGQPIQPLYVGHVDWYVDYSHGVRLMAGRILIGNQKLTTEEVLQDPHRSRILSREGPLNAAEIRKAAGW